ncbi:MAG: muconate/chloromuconate family cycloisomerase [Limnobacter sp.]|nr:muconate/chloromuconate family cycloisomerase [Limnobacter sp.]
MINQIQVYKLEVPTIRPHQLSVATMSSQTMVLVRVMCDDGHEGWGEATTIGGLKYGEESPDSMVINLQKYLIPMLVGQDAYNINACMRKLNSSIRGNRFAKCAIETALMDAQARRLGISVAELLGGAQVDALPVAWTLASGDTDTDIQEAHSLLELRRHRVFKLKIGAHHVQRDVNHVVAIKRALGDKASVRVDVNQAWDEPTANFAIPQLIEGGVDLIEQPLAIANIAGMARLTRRFSVPMMADEALMGPQDALRFCNQAAAYVFSIKIAQSGGLTQSRLVANLAELHGVSLYGGTMLEGPIGTIASAHLFSTFDDLQFGTELFGPLLLTDDILKKPLEYRDFCLHLPKGPGLGVEPDLEKIQNLASHTA